MSADAFLAALAEAGLAMVKADAVGDGWLHRYRVLDDKAGSANGWYVLHLDGTPFGAFGSWKPGQSLTWSPIGKGMPPRPVRRRCGDDRGRHRVITPSSPGRTNTSGASARAARTGYVPLKVAMARNNAPTSTGEVRAAKCLCRTGCNAPRNEGQRSLSARLPVAIA
jgi:hypothetical protein